MTRAQLEPVLRAAASIAQSDEIVVIGSQSILGAHPDAPELLLRSIEADVYPLANPDAWNVIDGAIGEGSTFHETFSYYAQGVGPETAILAAGWQGRAVRICSENTRGTSGVCLSPEDLALAKCAANREKDREFVDEMLRHKLVSTAGLINLLASLPVSEDERARIDAWLQSKKRNAEGV